MNGIEITLFFFQNRSFDLLSYASSFLESSSSSLLLMLLLLLLLFFESLDEAKEENCR